MRRRRLSRVPRLYWYPQDIPALQWRPPAEQRVVYRRYWWRAMRDWRVWLSLLAAPVGAATIAGPPLVTLGDTIPEAYLLVSAGWLGVAQFAWFQFALHRINRLILADHPHLCRSCGYDLTANTSGRCPECGAAVADAAS